MRIFVAALLPDVKGYSVTFPDVPGAITQGDSYEEAVANAHEALHLMLETEQEDGVKFQVRDPAIVAREVVAAGATPVALKAEDPN